jgi:hypothetical protein
MKMHMACFENKDDRSRPRFGLDNLGSLFLARGGDVIHAELACHAPHGRAVEEGLKPKKAVINCFISLNGSDAGTTRIIKN